MFDHLIDDFKAKMDRAIEERNRLIEQYATPAQLEEINRWKEAHWFVNSVRLYGNRIAVVLETFSGGGCLMVVYPSGDADYGAPKESTIKINTKKL